LRTANPENDRKMLDFKYSMKFNLPARSDVS
jgi:hypothetical protein